MASDASPDFCSLNVPDDRGTNQTVSLRDKIWKVERTKGRSSQRALQTGEGISLCENVVLSDN